MDSPTLFQKIYRHRELIFNFVVRDIKSRYKGSILGYLWTLLDPLLMMVIYILIFSVIVRIKVENYPIFILTGILPWQFFNKTVNRSMISLRENSNLMMKVYFPREIFPISQVVSGIFEFCITLIVLVPFLIAYHVSPTWKRVFGPVIATIQTFFVLGISLILSVLVAYLKDVTNLMSAALRIWFYLTPILYHFSMVPDKYQFFFLLNPMAIIISLYRGAILGDGIPDTGMVIIGILVSLLVFIVGKWFFSINESDVIKRL